MNPASRFADAATQKLTKLSLQIVSELQDKLEDADINDVAKIVSAVWSAYEVPVKFRDMLLGSAEQAAGISINIPDRVGFHKYYLNSTTVDGVKLSSKIYDAVDTGPVIQDIRQSIAVADKWSSLANDLAEQGVVSGGLPDYVGDLLEKGRQAASLTGDTDAYAKYRRQVSYVKRRAEGLVDSDSSELAQAYRDIANLSFNASQEVVDATIERAVIQKARANATRLIRTETARAYGTGAIYDAQQDDDAVGIRVSLSAIHEGYCICDFFVEADMYGMGPGIYPKDEVPEFPFHPHCMCLLDPWYKGEPGEYDDKAAKDTFDDLEEDEQKAIAGKNGTWKDVDWETHKVPKGFSEEVEED
jgi:cytochrome c553